MRRLLALGLSLLLAGCGTTAAPRPTPTATLPGVTDTAAHVTTAVVRTRTHRAYMLLYITMHNSSAHTYTPPTTTPFIDEALVEPNSRGTLGACSSDNSIGPGLAYASVPARSTQSGWLRCDFPPSTHVLAVFWLSHNIGSYHIQG